MIPYHVSLSIFLWRKNQSYNPVYFAAAAESRCETPAPFSGSS